MKTIWVDLLCLRSVLKIMKEAGYVFINYGIESMDENCTWNKTPLLEVSGKHDQILSSGKTVLIITSTCNI